MDIFKRPIIVLFLFGAVVIAMLWSYFGNISEQKKTEQQAAEYEEQTKEILVNLTTVDASDFDEFVRNEYAQARSKAEETDPANKLSAIQVILPSLLISSGDTRYVFSSDQDQTNNWTITFSQESSNYIRAEIPKDDFMGELQPIDTSLWKFNYVTAIQIMEKAGAKEWRETNGLSSVEMILKQDNSNSLLLVWDVTYYSGSQSISKTIEASTGKIIE